MNRSQSQNQAADRESVDVVSGIGHSILVAIETSHDVLAVCEVAGQKMKIFVPRLRDPVSRALRDELLSGRRTDASVTSIIGADRYVSHETFSRLVLKLSTGCCGVCVAVYDGTSFNVIGG